MVRFVAPVCLVMKGNKVEISGKIANEVIENLRKEGYDAVSKTSCCDISGKIHTEIYRTVRKYLLDIRKEIADEFADLLSTEQRIEVPQKVINTK